MADSRQIEQRTSRPGPSAVPRADELSLDDPALYLNRELIWLKFNARVLMQARDTSHPVLERVKFLAIAASNLDEFYMVRIASMLRQYRAGIDRISPDGLDIEQQVRIVRHAADAMLHDIGRHWSDHLRPLLAANGIQFLEPPDYTPDIRA